jgi:MFS family permease
MTTTATARNVRAVATRATDPHDRWRRFWLLVLVNAFVGSMVGLERTVLPLLAEAEFGLASRTAAFSFIVTFGLVKALTNLVAGSLSDRYGRKQVLVAGWLFALPVPILVIWAPSWSWIVFANVLLGINQGLTWSTTVIMKVDLLGPERRGFAMGLNEFAGYLAVALAALGTGLLAEAYGLRPAPFYLGIAFAAVGTALSVLFVRETSDLVENELGGRSEARSRASLRDVFGLVTWRHAALSSASQAGLVNNLNDGLAWGLLPILFAAHGLGIAEIGMLAFIYPAVWGILQLGTGALSDRWGRKWLIAIGMAGQGIALGWIALGDEFRAWAAALALLGVGTALVYPTLLAAVGDVARPEWRGSAIGVYRFWRDAGYAAGAIAAGVLSDSIGMAGAVGAVGALTMLSGVLVAVRMPETLHAGPHHRTTYEEGR